MQMPMAIAGPAIINGKYAKGEFTIPLCTIEGSLAASMNRGPVSYTHLTLPTILLV